MADNFSEFSEMLGNLSAEEEQWLKEQLAIEPNAGCPVFLVGYEEIDPDDTSCGFCVEFQNDNNNRSLWICSDGWGEPKRVAHLIQQFLKRFRPDQCWSLTYSNTCSKPITGEFGGGAVFVTANEIRCQHTHEFIGQQRTLFEVRKSQSAATS